MSSIIVIPTYNESKNIEKLVEEIISLKLGFSILIVDDNSPDGTGIIADKLADRFSQVKVIHRKNKNGRGSACIEGFRLALKENFDFILEMDADFSHPPSSLAELLSKSKKSDIVIGSRYLPESKIVGWGIKRRIFSRLANFYARVLLGINITDYTNGFRCYRKDVLKTLDFNKIRFSGYIVLSETAYYFHKRGFKFKEIPIVFVDRRRGQSNVTFKEILEAFCAILKLKISC
jgi:dolichol-phosphate mannosyltransferase